MGSIRLIAVLLGPAEARKGVAKVECPTSSCNELDLLSCA